MLLHDISLAGFRSFADPIRIGPFDERITVMHAPNGTGKTTLLDAFYNALLESHTVSGAKAESSMNSAGRNLTPELSVTFSTGGTRYRLDKRFFRGEYAKLSREEDGTFVALAEGEAATKFVRARLAATAPGRGPIKADEHFGLGALLWAPQGRVEIPKLSSNVLAQARGRLAGAAVTFGERDAGLGQLVAAWHGRYYTSKSQEAANAESANLPALRKAVVDATARFERARDDVAKLDLLRRRHEESAADRARYAEMTIDLEADVAKSRAAVVRFREVANARADAASKLASANERWALADHAVNAVTSARLALDAAERDAADVVAAHDRAVAIEATASERLRDARAAHEAASANVDASDRNVSIAGDATALVAALGDRATACERLERSEALARELDESRGTRSRLIAPTTTQMRAIRKLVAAGAAARTRLDAAVLHVTFTPDVSAALIIDSGATPSKTHVEGGVPFTISGSPAIVFAIDGIGKISAHGPTGSADEIGAELRATERELERALAQFGTADLVELERRLDAASELDAQIDRLAGIATDRSRDVGSTDDLRARIATLDGRIAALEERYPEWTERRPDAAACADVAATNHAAAKVAQKAAAAALRIATTDAESRSSDVRTAETACHAARGRILEARGKVRAREEDGLDDEARAHTRSDAGLAQVEARHALDGAEAAFATFPVDPHAECEVLENKLGGVRVAFDEARDAHAGTEALLDSEMSRGLYETMAEAETALFRDRDRLASELAEAAAAKLLYDTFKSVEADREASVLEPLRRRTADLYRRVAGGESQTLRFSRDLAFEGLDVAGSLIDQTLSGGESEQLQMVSRLALADLVTDGERQLVILDDTLGATDPRRFARFLAIVRELAETRMQFVIATCDKARYLGLSGAAFVDLEAVRSERFAAGASPR